VSGLQARRGVTLIELVVVMALIAIIAGVTAPALTALDRRDANATEVVVGLLRKARATAIERGVAVTMTIDPSAARYWLDVPDTTDVIVLPAGASLTASSARVHVRFAPDGGVAADPLFVRQGDRAIPITFDPWSGEVRDAQ